MTRWELSDTPKTIAYFSGKLSKYIVSANYMESLKIHSDLPTLWYENEAGEKWFPDLKSNECPQQPDGFIYQHSRFPNQLRHNILRMIVPEEVAKCTHPAEHVFKTGGWIDGIEGRECKFCGGTQTKKITDDWPEKWDAYGSRQLMTMENGFSEDLALALTKKFGWSLSKAILVAAVACERCMNVLAHECGIDWGYAEDSDDFKTSGTSCEFCKHLEISKPTPSLPIKAEVQSMQQDLKYPYLHPAVVEQVAKTVMAAWQMYYRASRDFINKKLEDWSAFDLDIDRILTNSDKDKDDIVEIEQNPQGITVKFWGIPKIRGNDPKALAELLDKILVAPNRYLSINDDILYNVVAFIKNLNHHIVYRAALNVFANECFEENTMAKILKYPELPTLTSIVGEPLCLQYYTTAARRAVWAIAQNNPQWQTSIDTINSFIDWFSENFLSCLTSATAAYISTNFDIFAHQSSMLPDDDFLDGVIDGLTNAERLEHLEETPIVMVDFNGNLHMLSGVYKRRILNRNNEQTMRTWILQADDVWQSYKKS